MGLFGGGSRSSSSSTTNTYNTDKRLVVGEDAQGISADNSTVTMNVERLDADLIGKALDFAGQVNTSAANGYGDLLNASNNMFGTMAQKVTDAYSRAQNDSKGALEQKTIVLIALAAAGTLAVLFWTKRG